MPFGLYVTWGISARLVGLYLESPVLLGRGNIGMLESLMAKKIRSPRTFSEAFDIDANKLSKEGVFDPILNVDTKLFIDPLLLSESRHKEFCKDAVASYRKHFKNLVSLLAKSKNQKDAAWRTAKKMMYFPEITGTCIGYGAGTIRGRSWGPKLENRVLGAAREVVDLGIDDPDLFLVVALLEEGIGPDLISDMTTNVILRDLENFNARLCKKWGIKTESFKFKNGVNAKFARNPLSKDGAPVILIPNDVLRELPIVTSWEDVGSAADMNSDLRARVNSHIGKIWEASIRKKKKEQIKRDAYASKDAFKALLDTIHAVPKTPYDVESDPDGHLVWMQVHRSIAKQFPLALSLPTKPTLDQIQDVVAKIIDHYRDLVENKGLWKELWSGAKRRPEKSAQRIFFAVADVYCKVNDLDITPEADSGAGPVDFKISSSYKNRVLVELKLSSNPKVVPGYEKQLGAYRKAESTTRASYVVIDVGSMGNKDKKLVELKNNAVKRGEPASSLEFVNGKKQISASRRK